VASFREEMEDAAVVLTTTPNLPFKPEWETMTPDQKLDALHKSVDQVWKLLSDHCQHLQICINQITARLDQAKEVQDEQAALPEQ